MDKKAIYNLSYGVFILGSHSEGKINACITNTCFQAAVSPVRIAISVIKQNLTCEMIEKSGFFSLSVLDSTCTFQTIKRFGYQSGRDADKFEGFSYGIDENGCPFTAEQCCSVLACKVVSSVDLGSHMLFVAEVKDAKVTSANPPLTYAEYQSNIKPKNGATDEQRKIVGWRCKICGYEYTGETLPYDYECPLCGHPAEDFEPIYG